MKFKICFCVCCSFLDIILNFELILLMTGLFKYHAEDQGASVEDENNISKYLGKFQFLSVQNLIHIYFLNKPNQLKPQTNGSMLL